MLSLCGDLSVQSWNARAPMTDLSLLTYEEALARFGSASHKLAADDLVLTVGSHINQGAAQEGRMKLRDFITVGKVAEVAGDRVKITQLHTYYSDGGASRASGDEWVPLSYFTQSAHEHIKEQKEFFESM